MDEDALRALLESPIVFVSAASSTREAGARVDTLTETHAVYPVHPSSMMGTLKDDAQLTGFMPNLADHEIVCTLEEGSSRQRQRTDFGVLIFSLGAEYLIDVEHVQTGPDVFASRWALVDSLDGRLGYLYGSWFFELIELDGVPMTYVRHYVRTGLTTRVPGVRAFVGSRLAPQMEGVFNALYEESVRRFRRSTRVTLAD